jgi:TolB protein
MLFIAECWKRGLLMPVRWTLLMLVIACAGMVSAQTPDLTVTAGEGRDLLTIAVPDFKPAGGGQTLGATNMGEVMNNDFRLSGYFQAPSNKQFVIETDLLDAQKGGIQFADWHRLGAAYLVKGSYEISGTNLSAKVETYDVVAQKYIFGRSYDSYRVDNARALAHRISDDIVERLTATPGVARTRLAFIREVDPYGKTKQTCVMDADGFAPQAYTDAGELTAAPAWGANGTEIYYTTYRDFNPDLAGIILRTKHKWWVSRRAGFNVSPSWNEKLKKLALTFTRDGNSEIYTITREGKDPQRLTFDRSIDCEPSWSPDGSQIAFTSDRGGRPQIYVMDANTKNARRLTTGGDYNTGATWSPDGKMIAYQSRIGGDFQIFIMNADGGNPQQITNGPYNNEDPTWAPNSQLIAFTSDRTGSRQIYSMYAMGGDAHQLTKGTPCKSAAWSPFLP